jgi:hypothetical protein
VGAVHHIIRALARRSKAPLFDRLVGATSSIGGIRDQAL